MTIAVSNRTLATPLNCATLALEAKIPANMVHALSDSLLASAEGMREMALTIRQYESLSLDAFRMVGVCLKKGREDCDAWDAVCDCLLGK